MSEITQHRDDRKALAAIKQRIQASQMRAVLAVNAEQLGRYWDSGPHLTLWQPEGIGDRLSLSKWPARPAYMQCDKFSPFSPPILSLSHRLWGNCLGVFLLSGSHSKPTPQWSSLL